MAEPVAAYDNRVYGVETSDIIVSTQSDQPGGAIGLVNPTYGELPDNQPRPITIKARQLPPTPIANGTDLGFENPGYLAPNDARAGENGVGGNVDHATPARGDTDSVYSEPSYYRDQEGKTIVLPRKKMIIVAVAVVLALVVVALIAVLLVAINKPIREREPEPMPKMEEDVERTENLMSASLKVTGGPYQVYVPAYRDNSSSEFKDFATKFSLLIERALEITTADEILQTIKVKALEPGSVVVHYELFFRGDPDMIAEHNDAKIRSFLVSSLTQENIKGQFLIDLNSVTVGYGPYRPAPKPTAKPCMPGGNVFQTYCGKVVDYKTVSPEPYRGEQSAGYLKLAIGMFKNVPTSYDCKQRVMSYICRIVFPKCENGERTQPCATSCRMTYHSCPKLDEYWPKEDCFSIPEEPGVTCDEPILLTCKDDERLCMNGLIVTGLSTCVAESKFCDGKKDCMYGEDERNCPTKSPPPSSCTTTPDFTTVCDALVPYSQTALLPELALLRTPQYMTAILGLLKMVDQLGQGHLISEDCRRHIVPFWCHMAYPKCDASGIRPACRSYCTRMFSLCSSFASDHYRLEDCNVLPVTNCMEIPEQDVCEENQILCRNGPVVSKISTCIDAERKCNGIRECLDGSDEPSDCLPPKECPQGYISCVEGTALAPTDDIPSTCIRTALRCNDMSDCTDASDEKGCETSCPGDKFKCVNGYDATTGSRCIDQVHMCDGTYQCTDHSDEDCDMPTHCLQDEFRCVTGVDKYSLSPCILAPYRCDGNPDCIDKSDEVGCPTESCEADQFKCVTGLQMRFPYRGFCIANVSRCDGKLDCADRSDEAGCSSCPDNGFRCTNGTLKAPLDDQVCAPSHAICNGIVQCMDESDENENCATTDCAADEFKCSDGYYMAPGGGRCVPSSYNCDRKQDCSDNSDEVDCTYACAENEFMCKVGALIKPPYRNYCIPKTEQCDGHVGCHDESDEVGCASNCTSQQLACGPLTGVYTRECIMLAEKCDGRRDCADGRDEGPQHCDPGNCLGNSVRCAAGRLVDDMTKRCYPFQERCDGTQHCMDNSDERECDTDPPSCQVDGRFRCTDGFSLRDGKRCIPKRYVCDAVQHCSDRSDELGCNYKCNATQFQCASGTVTRPPYTGFCIGVGEECDGHIDCADASDEIDCENKPCAAGHTRCPSNDENAKDVHNADFCIRTDWLCDGHADCTDLSDETLAQCNLLDNGCQAGQFRCNGTLARYPFIGHCIGDFEVCDGYVDCTGGNDEPEDCLTTRPCPSTQGFRCGSNGDGTPAQDRYNRDACIPHAWVCDGGYDCTNLRDEIGCGT